MFSFGLVFVAKNSHLQIGFPIKCTHNPVRTKTAFCKKKKKRTKSNLHTEDKRAVTFTGCKVFNELRMVGFVN